MPISARGFAPHAKFEGEIGVAFPRSGIDITADAQFAVPILITIEAGARLRWNASVRPWLSLAPTLFAGGAYYRSPDTDDGGTSGRGLSVQVGFEVRFHFQPYRAGIAVRAFNLDLRWFQTRSGGGYRQYEFYPSLDFGGLLVTF